MSQHDADYRLAYQHIRFSKQAASAVTSYGLHGRLVRSSSGWILLEVPNALLRGAFDALQEPGIELPTQSSGQLNAHISVMRPEELAQLPSDRLSELGQHFSYTLGPVKTCVPTGWADMSRVWFIEVQSPGLKQLRKSYGLTPLPHNDEYPFHITIARRRKHVLSTSDVSKAAGLVASVANYVPAPRWEDVPQKVAAAVAHLRPVATAIHQLDLPLEEGDAIFYNPHAQMAHVWTKAAADWCRACAAAQDFPELRQVAWAVGESLPIDPTWHLVKVAGGYTQPLADAWQAIQAPLGGPNPLTSSLVGGLMAGGLGYAGGKLLDRFLPEEYFDKGTAAKSLGLMGAAAGAAPGLLWGVTQYQNNPTTGKPYTADGAGWTSAYPWKAAAARDDDRTGLTTKTIPVDAFNRVVWNNVGAVANPFGTKDRWGDNSAPMYTPAPVAAAVSGLLSGASALHGNAASLSPLDVAAAAAVSGFKGWTTGLVTGKLLGAMAGLKPEYQQKLQTTGLWGGLLTGAVKSLFGGT